MPTLHRFAGRSTPARVLVAALLLTISPEKVRAQETGLPAEMLSLEAVYVLARQRNAMLQAVQATVEAIRAQESSARLPPDPQLQIGVMNAELPGLGSGMPTFMAPALQAMQMFPFPGKLALSGRIARQSTAMVDAQATETWWEIRSRAAMAFYGIFSIDRQLDVMLETLQWLEDFGQVAKAMYAAGEGRQADVLRAGVEVARMDAEIARMQAMRTAAAARLNAVLNRPADTEVTRPALPDLPLVLPDTDLPRLTVYKSPTCGCCAKWVAHVRRSGFKVKIVEMSDVKPMKDRLGVPGDLVSCHTAVVDGYVIEGHVPAEDIRRMLTERDAGAGIAVRGMPAGAPGMETANPRPYEVVAFDSQGNQHVYASR